MKSPLKSPNHWVLAYVSVDHRGVHTITDQQNRVLGYFDPRTNRTTNRHHRTIGLGFQLPRLLPGDLSEDGAGIIKPTPPMSPAQGDREAQRRVGVQDRLHDEQRRHAQKVADLKAKLNPPR